jgi:hypothetical protein
LAAWMTVNGEAIPRYAAMARVRRGQGGCDGRGRSKKISGSARTTSGSRSRRMAGRSTRWRSACRRRT